MMKERIPSEIVASLLAATTAIIALPPFNLPPWAIFIGWAGTFAAGGPTKETFKKIWPAMPMGSLFGLSVVLIESILLPMFPQSYGLPLQMATIFVVNTILMYVGHVPLFSFVPGMFFGFASFFATYFGGWGPDPTNPVLAFAAVVFMNFLGPIYAWLNVKLTFPVPGTEDTHHME